MNIIREIQKRWFPKTLKCVYRKDILEYALKHHEFHGIKYSGLCGILSCAFDYYNIDITSLHIKHYLPLFTNNNAGVLFNAKVKSCPLNTYGYYWWPQGEWNTGRLDFLKWLLEQYKDDKTNLKEL